MKDIRDKKPEDLIKLLQEKEELLKNFRFGISGSKTRNVREGRGLKRDIARIHTALVEKRAL
jgi:ribosomal protein L29